MPSWRTLILKSCALWRHRDRVVERDLAVLVEPQQRLVERLHAVVLALFHRVADEVGLLGVDDVLRIVPVMTSTSTAGTRPPLIDGISRSETMPFSVDASMRRICFCW